jgi:hypothetical protein
MFEYHNESIFRALLEWHRVCLRRQACSHKRLCRTLEGLCSGTWDAVLCCRSHAEVRWLHQLAESAAAQVVSVDIPWLQHGVWCPCCCAGCCTGVLCCAAATVVLDMVPLSAPLAVQLHDGRCCLAACLACCCLGSTASAFHKCTLAGDFWGFRRVTLVVSVTSVPNLNLKFMMLGMCARQSLHSCGSGLCRPREGVQGSQ